MTTLTPEQIKQEHPELEKKLGGLSMTLKITPPRIFGDPLGRAPSTDPLDRPAPQVRPGPIFGLRLVLPSEALAAHLELPSGRGALVEGVVPRSQAEDLGFEQWDVVVGIDGEDVGIDEAVRRLREAGRDPAGTLDIDILRRGQRLTLQR